MLAVILRETANTVVGEKLVGIVEPFDQPAKLMLVDDRHYESAILHGAGVADQLLAIADEPVDVAQEFGMLLQLLVSQKLHGEHGDQAHQRAHAELVEVAVGISQDVVEESVLLIP